MDSLMVENNLRLCLKSRTDICACKMYLTVLSGFVPLVGYRATLALSGYLLSNAAFVFSAVYFYRYVSYFVSQILGFILNANI
jgi:ABC-type transport system involved in cytochrome bd biosynthesis fused ATPase/permease subunit